MKKDTITPDNEGNKMPHNGNLLTNYLLNNRINRAELARKMNRSNTSIYQYAESPSLQMGILWNASLILKHNFVAELGALLPVDYSTPKETELNEQIRQLEAKVAALESMIEKKDIEISVYKSIVGK